jgi:hypothetical protein
MSRGGAKPGERRGGRQKGTPNRATVQKQLIAAQIAERTVADARTAGRKLAKEVLENFMFGFADLAEHYKPTPEVERPNPHADEDKFAQYAELAIDCAKALAPYQSPTFRAVVVAPAVEPKEKRIRFTLNIFDHDGRELPPPEAPARSPAMPFRRSVVP